MTLRYLKIIQNGDPLKYPKGNFLTETGKFFFRKKLYQKKIKLNYQQNFIFQIK